MKMKTKMKEDYTSPGVVVSLVMLEESIAAITSPVTGVTLDDWNDSGTNDPGDSGNIMLGL